ncbi:MAG: methylated-DNA--[protein]-cysteine S-methyltransferase [Candidatus Symbiobacter sp.]|nr:methylated-DNA--[protein]-cysteine S-methyltransferase [Candidatus Symbiobacter sp.]
MTEMLRIKIEIIDPILGYLLVAASRQGLRYIALGDDAALLEHEMLRRLPQAEFSDQAVETTAMTEWFAALVELCHGRVAAKMPPLDIHGTDFQKTVWAALFNIPRGETRTYQDIAQKIGNPKASRAVGAMAVARNPLGIIIPCHRVVNKDQNAPEKYGFGPTRKRELLRREGVKRYLAEFKDG